MEAVSRVNAEDIRVGDVLALWCGQKTVVRIEAYRGPLSEIVFAIARYVPSAGAFAEGGISLCRGDVFEVLARGPS